MTSVDPKGNSASSAVVAASTRSKSKSSGGGSTKPEVGTPNIDAPKQIEAVKSVKTKSNPVKETEVSPKEPLSEKLYHRWGKDGGEHRSVSLNSLEARSMPVQKATKSMMAKDATKHTKTMDEILDQIYQRQYHHALSDSCSSGSYTGASGIADSKHMLREQHNFGPYATRETLKRSVFYGACGSAVILLSVFVVGMSVFVPLVWKKLENLSDRIGNCSKFG